MGTNLVGIVPIHFWYSGKVSLSARLRLLQPAVQSGYSPLLLSLLTFSYCLLQQQLQVARSIASEELIFPNEAFRNATCANLSIAFR